MRENFDFAPYRRSTVGFDRLFDMIENAARTELTDGYPPFDLEKQGDDAYRITLAVAGFRPDEIEVVAHQNQLVVTGRKGETEDGRDYLHRGIATRDFERRFQLADFVQVRSAEFDNGLLRISLEREVPEQMKPRKIEIGERSGSSRISDQRPSANENEAARTAA